MTGRDRRWIVALCGVLLLGVGICLAGALARIWIAASAVKADLDALEALLAGDVQVLDVEAAVELVHATRADVEALDDVSRPFLWMASYLGWLPGYGPDVQAAPVLLEIARDLTASGQDLVTSLEPLLERVAGSAAPGGPSILTDATRALDEASSSLETTLMAVRRAQDLRQGLDAERLSPRVRQWVARLDQLLPVMEQGVEAALLLPNLLGAQGPRTYLVLVQNEDELRPTGGFISGVAEVTIADGVLQNLRFEDSYGIDDFSHAYPDPPAALRDTMGVDLWLFRDSNWSPDYPTSAQDAISLYGISRDAEIDGVIALGQQMVRLAVGAIGPIQVAGYDQPITGENVIQMSQQAWEPEGGTEDMEWWVHRKDFMAALLEGVIRQLEGGLERERAVSLARTVFLALREKHLLVYARDPAAAALLADLGWDGAMRSSPGDYLMIVDSNVGFNKVNPLVEESVDYVVDLTDLAHPRAVVTIRHSHLLESRATSCDQTPRYDPTYRQMMERCYWDYLRVYVPAAAQLVEATPHPISGLESLRGLDSPGWVSEGSAEPGYNAFATFLRLAPGERLETRFEYSLPLEVLRSHEKGLEYTLVLQKQPGAMANPVRVVLLLPPGMEMTWSDPEPSTALESGLEYAFALETDCTLSVVLSSVDP